MDTQCLTKIKKNKCTWGDLLTHWGLKQWLTYSRRPLQINFLEWKLSWFKRNWNWFVSIGLTMRHHFVKKSHGTEQATYHYPNQRWQISMQTCNQHHTVQFKGWLASIYNYVLLCFGAFTRKCYKSIPFIWNIIHIITSYHWHTMTSSNGNIFRVTGHLCVAGDFPAYRQVTRGFDVFFSSAPELTVE